MKRRQKVLILVFFVLLVISYYFGLIPKKNPVLDLNLHCVESTDYSYKKNQKYPYEIIKRYPYFHSNKEEYDKIKNQQSSLIKKLFWGEGEIKILLNDMGIYKITAPSCNAAFTYTQKGWVKKDETSFLSSEEMRETVTELIGHVGEYMVNPDVDLMTVSEQEQTVEIQQQFNDLDVRGGLIKVHFYNGKILVVDGHWWDIPKGFLHGEEVIPLKKIISKVNGRKVRYFQRTEEKTFLISRLNIKSADLVFDVGPTRCTDHENRNQFKSTARLIWNIRFTPFFRENELLLDVDAITGDILRVYVPGADEVEHSICM